ncbi:MAG: methylated-DNA--[protein]-cysteine S-methyltransferase [Candidatus Bathyanammoxibius sp.]
MGQTLRHGVFQTDLGWIAIAVSAKGLTAVTLPQSSPERAVEQLGETAASAERADGRFEDLADRFRDYYRGGRQTFPDDVDLSRGTPFQQAVWLTARSIPYGETRSYGWIASAIGRPRAARAVGQAMGSNPLAIVVPCHRVVAGDGGLGGFGGGLEMKRRLLEIEGRLNLEGGVAARS